MIYHTKVKSSAVFVHDASLISPLPLLFFGGDIAVGKDGSQDTIAVDDWIVFQASPQIAELVKVSVDCEPMCSPLFEEFSFLLYLECCV